MVAVFETTKNLQKEAKPKSFDRLLRILNLFFCNFYHRRRFEFLELLPEARKYFEIHALNFHLFIAKIPS